MSDKAPSHSGIPFEPVDPWKSEGLTYRRRNLPHLEVPEATYFVTFRCRSGIELSPANRDVVFAAISNSHPKLLDLDAAVVMPDHVHLVFRLNRGATFPSVIQKIKGGSARQINQLLNSSGPVWMDESFDHIIRNGSELA